MPGWAEVLLLMRYMDAHNENEFTAKTLLLESVDLYIGVKHATHLLFSFWNKF
jgi:hypothetical protein